jgi:GDP-L-fucose synthase
MFEIDKDAPFYVAGHRGMVGSAMWRLLEEEGHSNLIGMTRQDLDLTNRNAVFSFFQKHKPKYVVLAAARVGGIMANVNYPVQFLTENLQIQVNVMDAALAQDVERLVFLGSSCIYPKDAPQPIDEEFLLTGPLEPTNEPYAIAKIAGIKQVQAVRKQYGKPWFSVMPPNLYGPNDNFSEGESHVMAALIKRFTEAKQRSLSSITNWGTGRPLREFLHVDNLARKIYELMKTYDGDSPINIGGGEEMTIKELSDIIQQTVGYEGTVLWDSNKPDGVRRKRLATEKSRSLTTEIQLSPLRDYILSVYETAKDGEFGTTT